MNTFDSPTDLLNPNRTFLTGGSGAIGPGKLNRRTALMAALICLAFLASFTAILIRAAQPEMVSYWIMAAAFLGTFFLLHTTSSAGGKRVWRIGSRSSDFVSGANFRVQFADRSGPSAAGYDRISPGGFAAGNAVDI